MDRHFPRFLVVEDNPGDFVLVEDLLNEQFTLPVIIHAQDCKQAIATLCAPNNVFDAVLLDLSLPDRSGQSLIETIIKACAQTPVIVLTGLSDMKFSVRSLSLGVADYVLKDELTPLSLYKSIVYSWERQRYTAELAASEKNYSDMFRLSPQPMWVFDIQTLRFLDVNDSAIDHYGYTRNEFLSMTILDIRPPDERESVKKLLNELRSDQNVVKQGMFVHKKKNGDLIKVEIQSSNIDSHGIPARLVLASDVTERYQYINEIEEQNKKLREISWMQSHIMRAPLSRIMGLIPLIGMLRNCADQEDSELKKILDYLEISANELDEVIRDIIKKSAIENTH